MSADSDSPLDLRRIFEAAPGNFLVLAPDIPRFTILAVTDSYLQATRTARAAIVGKGVFDVFPDNPDDPETKAVDFARASFTLELKQEVNELCQRAGERPRYTPDFIKEQP